MEFSKQILTEDRNISLKCIQMKLRAYIYNEQSWQKQLDAKRADLFGTGTIQ